MLKETLLYEVIKSISSAVVSVRNKGGGRHELSNQTHYLRLSVVFSKLISGGSNIKGK